MTVEATLSQHGKSVSIPLLAEGATPLVAQDIASPHLITHEGGMVFPRTQDQWSKLGQFTLLGRFQGDNAYDDAITLAEIIQQDGDGEDMILDIPALDELDSDIRVAPSAGSDRALDLAYEPGRTDVVDVDLGLTRVGQTLGAYDRDIATPTASGDGPIELEGVPLDVDFTLDRYVGRPSDTTRKTQAEYPNYLTKPKVVTDQFDISLAFTSDALSLTNQLADAFRARRGRDSMTLDFNGVFGYGAFDVMPRGNQALRLVRDAGKEGVVMVPRIELQRVQG